FGQRAEDGIGPIGNAPHWEWVPSEGKSVHDPACCSICQYLAQAKLAASPLKGFYGGTPAVAFVPLVPWTIPAIYFWTFYARAPPTL
ncbi:MAG TPA: hypothetical protein PLQ00_10610, partial [Thermoguttaceae bacterium]|nr:hypothetical protein [Thermoguttaceae bacterium]